MGFEGEVEQSMPRPCRHTNGRSKRTWLDMLCWLGPVANDPTATSATAFEDCSGFPIGATVLAGFWVSDVW